MIWVCLWFPRHIHSSTVTEEVLVLYTVIELRDFNKKKKEKENMDKMGTLFLAIIFTFGAFIWYNVSFHAHI